MFHAKTPWRNDWLLASLIVFAFLAPASPAAADDAVVAIVLTDLHHPCGIAVRPGGTADRYELFIADSGAGRVVRWSNLAPDQTDEVVTGFNAEAAADPSHQTGPLTLLFLDPGLLVIGTTRDDGGDLLRAYELPEDDRVLRAEQAGEASAELATADKRVRGAACFGLTRSRANDYVPDMLVTIVRGDGDGDGDDGGGAGRGRLQKARIQAGIVAARQPFGAAGPAHAPTAVTTSNSGRIVVVQTSSPDGNAASRLTFYNPIDGTVELDMATDRQNVVGLAYSPISGSLYAADFAGGIHRIDDASEPGRPACRTVKVADVSGPTALAFAPDGALFIVTFGSGDNNGTLQVITGNL